MSARQPERQFRIINAKENVIRDSNKECQTCFRLFETPRELHEHVQLYRLEQQHLIRRLQEVQAHLPRKNNFLDSLYSFEECEDGLDADTDDDSSEYVSEEEHDNVRVSLEKTYLCTIPHCGKRYKDEQTRDRHFETHVLCSELCTYCREPLRTALQYRTHRQTCRARARRKNSQDETHWKRRNAQLRRVVKSLLSNSSVDAVRGKRKGETHSEELPSPKRAALNHMQLNGNYCAPSLETATRAAHEPDPGIQYSSSFPLMEGYPGVSNIAPIFLTGTIPPFPIDGPQQFLPASQFQPVHHNNARVLDSSDISAGNHLDSRSR